MRANKTTPRRLRPREYAIWCGMKTRCTNPSVKIFPYYGGRGITVCPQWASSFEAFLQDMGPCPPNLSLERRDNNKGYAPENCYWATREEQGNNKRSNRLIVFNGQTLTVSAWARQYGLSDACLHARVFRSRWPMDKALSTPAKHKRGLLLTFQGKTMRVTQWNTRLGYPDRTIDKRLLHGWSVERALSTPPRQKRPH